MPKGEPPRCYTCHKIVTFSDQFIGKNGRKIPLDPETEAPHDCPMREKNPSNWTDVVAQGLGTDKDDHGNEDLEGVRDLKIIKDIEQKRAEAISPKEYVERLGYVDHTTAAKGRFRAFVAKTVEELNEVANNWLEVQNIRFKQWGQLQVTSDGFAITLYYEEVAKK